MAFKNLKIACVILGYLKRCYIWGGESDLEFWFWSDETSDDTGLHIFIRWV
jgi:hypothetical protein